MLRPASVPRSRWSAVTVVLMLLSGCLPWERKGTEPAAATAARPGAGLCLPARPKVQFTPCEVP